MTDYILTALLGLSGVGHVLQGLWARRLKQAVKPVPVLRIGDTILSTDALLKLDTANLARLVDEYEVAKRRLSMLGSAGLAELEARTSGKVK